MSNVLMPDRRRHVRIVTLKNFGIFVLACFAVLATAELVARIRRPAVDGYGRIVQRQLPAAPAVATRAPEVVHEGEIPDQNAADPWLVEPAARSQYLGDPQLPVQAAAPPAPAPETTEAAPKLDGGSHVAIVGNGNGVKLVTGSSPARPQLSGGIFKSGTTSQ